jgi:hypothetical protein
LVLGDQFRQLGHLCNGLTIQRNNDVAIGGILTLASP